MLHHFRRINAYAHQPFLFTSTLFSLDFTLCQIFAFLSLFSLMFREETPASCLQALDRHFSLLLSFSGSFLPQSIAATALSHGPIDLATDKMKVSKCELPMHKMMKLSKVQANKREPHVLPERMSQLSHASSAFSTLWQPYRRLNQYFWLLDDCSLW